MNEQERALTARYAICQSGYWMVFCAVNGFASVFLLARSFTSGQIGALLACGNIIAAVLQPLAAQKADRGGKMGLKNLTLLLGLICLCAVVGIYLVPGSMTAIGGFFIISLSSIMVVQPLINSIGVYYMNRGEKLNYGLARAMGSLAYALLSMVLGILVEKYNENAILGAGMLACLIMLVMIVSFRMKSESFENHGNGEQKKTSLLVFLKRYRQFSLMLLGLICIFIYHFVSNTYMFQIVEAVGGGSKEMGTAVAIAAMAELPMMIFFTPIVKRVGAGRLLKIAGIFFFIKALLNYLAGSVTGIYLMQAIQMFSFAIYCPASVYYANQVMQEEDKVKGQALITAAFTIGAIIGNFTGGKLIDWSGVPAMLILGAASAAVGMIILFLTIPGEKKKNYI